MNTEGNSSNPRSSGAGKRDEPGPGDDVACVNCGERSLDTGLECDNCGFDNYEAVTGKPFAQGMAARSAETKARPEGQQPGPEGMRPKETESEREAPSVQVPPDVLKAAQDFVENDYRGPLARAKKVFDWVAAQASALPAAQQPAVEPVAWRAMKTGTLIDAQQVRDLWPSEEERAAAELRPLVYASPTAVAWQPIETAPKDGTDILLSNGVVVSEGHWLHQEGYIRERRDIDGRYIDQDESEGFDGWIDWFGGMRPEPTHWMPKPPPPLASPTGEKTEQPLGDALAGPGHPVAGLPTVPIAAGEVRSGE